MLVVDSAHEEADPHTSPVKPASSSAPPPSLAQLHFIERKVVPNLDDAADRDATRWILDTGASNHMSGSRAAFADLDTAVTGSVRFGDGSVARIEGSETVLFHCKNGEHRALTNVYFLPRLTTNIISVGQLDEAGYQVLVEHGVMRVRDEEGRLLAKIPRSPGRMYNLDVTIARPVCLAARTDDDAWRWHQRFGHIHFAALRKTGREELVRGLPVIDQVDQVCDACLAGKQKRVPFPQKALWRSTEPLQLLHGDICGPITPATPSGNKYFLLFVDDYSRFMWVALLPTKDAAVTAIKNIQAAAERKSGKKLLMLRTDRGGEFTAADFGNYCAQLGVRRQFTAPYMPQQNGVVERQNQTVVGAARSMMKAKSLPGVFWGEAVSTAVYLLNRSSCKAIGGRTPYQLWNGHTPSVQHLRTFSCIAHTKVNSPHQKKLDDRSCRMVFVGYESGSMAYRVYDPPTRRVHISRDVVFDEAAAWAWSATDSLEPNDFIIEELEQQEPSVITTTSTTMMVSPASGSASPAPSGRSVSPPSGVPMAGSPAAQDTPQAASHPQVEFASPTRSRS
jgi:hypothetical protein